MKTEQVSAVARELLLTAELFGESLSEARSAAYLEALSDLEADAICLALKRLRQTAEWFPKPTHIRAVLRGDVEMQAHEAWELVRSSGTMQEVREAFPELRERAVALDALEACGGLRWMNEDAPERDVPYMYRQFIRAYGIADRLAAKRALLRSTRAALPPAPSSPALEATP